MSDRAELLEAILENFPEGVALLGEDGQVRFWNRAAASVTGFASVELIGRALPDELKSLLELNCLHAEHDGPIHAALAHARHKQGYEVAAMVRPMVLRDGMGCRIGTAVVFHPAECLDALPHGATGEDDSVQASQDDLTERLEALQAEFRNGGAPFGVLWVTVDQAHELRRTHGAGACDAMLARMERTLAHGLRPAEYMGRWGEDEFLIVCHERTQQLLTAHAHALAVQARNADFRWWGDRVPLTVSMGAAQAESHTTLAALLERARTAMLTSRDAGGDQITAAAPVASFGAPAATEEQACSPS